MASAGLQLVSIFETTTPGQQLNQLRSPIITITNPNVAQTAPPAPDTVTLTPQTAQGQQAQTNQQATPQFELVVVEENIFLGTGNTAAAQAPQQTAAQQTQVQTTVPAAQPAPAAAQPAAAPGATTAATNTAADAAPAAAATTAAGATAASSSAQTVQQQEIAQLDQALQQLGIDPNTIPLFNRLAMLLFANDPAALQAFVQGLQSAGQQTSQSAGQTQPAAGAAAPAPATAGTAAASAANPATPAQQPAQTTAPAAPQFLAAELTFTEVQGPLSTPASANQSTAAAQPSQTNTTAATPSPNDVVVRFREFQLAFAATAGAGQNTGHAVGADSNSKGAINVTV